MARYCETTLPKTWIKPLLCYSFCEELMARVCDRKIGLNIIQDRDSLIGGRADAL